VGHEPGLLEVMYSTRAMRRLKTDPVPDQLLVKLIEAANQAPSGSNLQYARWLVIKDLALGPLVLAPNKGDCPA
jgi:nitroreductase